MCTETILPNSEFSKKISIKFSNIISKFRHLEHHDGMTLLMTVIYDIKLIKTCNYRVKINQTMKLL